jgi:hypothetical protein
MSKPKLSMGECILTNNKIMLVIGGEKENDTWRYSCHDKLVTDDKTEHFVREHEIQAVFRNNQWTDIG